MKMRLSVFKFYRSKFEFWFSYHVMGLLLRTGGPEPLFICIQTLSLKKELLARELGFIYQNEADGPLFARITLIYKLNTPKLTFPPSFVNFLSGRPLRSSPPRLTLYIYILCHIVNIRNNCIYMFKKLATSAIMVELFLIKCTENRKVNTGG